MTQNSTQFQLLRGTEAQNDAYTGSPGELTVDTTNNLLRLHDGVTPGGHLIGSGSGGGGGSGSGFPFSGSAAITGSLTVSGSLTVIGNINGMIVSASRSISTERVDVITGGSSTGEGIYSGSFYGTASWALNGGGGGGTYTNATAVPTTLGGIVAGSTFASVPLTTMFDTLLYPYQVPTFSSFLMSGQSTTLEVGDNISAGTKTFTWSTTNPSNISASSISIYDWTNSTTVPIASSLTDDGTENVSVSAVSKSSATSHVYRISGSNTQNTGFTRDFTVNWRWRMYWGTASMASLVASDITGSLNSSSLVSNSAGTFSFGATGYKYIAYPTLFGEKTTFKDVSTGFDVDMQAPVTTAVSNSFGIGTNYYVHRTTNTLGGSITITVS